MKATAFFIAFLIYLMCITSSPSYFNMLTTEAERNAFAYSDEVQENIQMKPLSRGDSLGMREHGINLKLMTYNMHRGIGMSGKLDLDATAEVIKSKEPNIIALQEVERHSIRTGFRDQIKLLAEKLDMNFAYGKSINVLTGEYGNGVLSSFPIEEYQIYDLPSLGEQRTLLRTIVNIDGVRLAVYNTHLGLNEAERKEQETFILDMTAAETLDYVLMGDMNSSADKLTTLSAFMKDSAKGSEKELYNTFEDANLKDRIDYIFISSGMEVKDYDVVLSEASDHYPVVCEAVLK